MLAVLLLAFSVLVQSLTMQITNYGTNFNDQKLYENTQIQIRVTRSIPGSNTLTLSFHTSNPKLAWLGPGINPNPVRLQGSSVTAYFIISSDDSVTGSRNITFFVNADSPAEPPASFATEVHEHDGKSISLELSSPFITEGHSITGTLTRNYQGDTLTATLTAGDDHPTHITFTPNQLVFDTNVLSVGFQINAPENDCYDPQDLLIDITANAPPVGQSVKYITFSGNDAARLSLSAETSFLGQGQTTVIHVIKNFYDPLTVKLSTDNTRIHLSDQASPDASSPIITSVDLPAEDQCRSSGVDITALIVSEQTGVEVFIAGEAVFRTKAGNATWHERVGITVVTAKEEDNSLFASKNLLSTVGSMLAVLVLIIVLICGIRYWHVRKSQPAASFGRLGEEMEVEGTSQSKFTISDNADAQGYLTGNTDQLLPRKDTTDLELSSKVVATLGNEADKPTPAASTQ